MYKGFELKILDDSLLFNDYYNVGKDMYDKNKRIIELQLNKFLLPDGSLDGSKMQDNWFPQVKADIFISHSHADENLAISLGGWLYENFGLIAFIDSCIWGYSNDLLRIIDNKYCLKTNGETYSYEKRNISTSHVYMMLSTALTMMIDKTECIFFLNTPNSITTSDVMLKTKSPWIYSEIATTKMIRRNPLIRERKLKKVTESFSTDIPINAKYDVNTDHLIKLRMTDLQDWDDKWPYNDYHSPNFTRFALDELYKLKNQ